MTAAVRQASAPGWLKLVMPIGLLVLWQYASWRALVDPRILPPPAAVLERGWQELIEGRLIINIAASLARDLSGFTIGSILGIVAGFALGLSSVASRYIGPTFNAFKQIAIFAWVPLLSVWFGTGEQAKIVFVSLGAFTPVVVNTWEGAASISVQHREAARVLCLDRWQFLRKVGVPSAMPSIFTGLHLGLFYSWLATVGAEYFMSIAPGIGGMIIEGRVQFDMPLVMLGVALLALIGYTLNRIAEFARHRMLRWQSH
jgi:sulfonate transport system permease protein